MKAKTILLALITALLLISGTGCNTVGADSDTVTAFHNNLRITFELSSRTVDPGDEITVTVQLRNVSGQPVSMITAVPVLFAFYAMQGETVIPFEGTLFLFPGIIGSFEIGVGQTHTVTHQIRVRLQESDPVTGQPVGVPAGTYKLVAVPTTISINGEPGSLSELSQSFQVR
ncbi:MAG: hypothetical protein LAT75_08480 [Candidatus Cyclonatronum sp.]|uniref:hypothetical protein n=1 Tax=Cyclonatronum sp. TaxID=3024185 RepID=UPI0025C124DD|nr:hypothetical protein [Cyclonatronum sp.]MCH8486888.1 hypothetical protein [Cyclonatronum sp.]